MLHPSLRTDEVIPNAGFGFQLKSIGKLFKNGLIIKQKNPNR